MRPKGNVLVYGAAITGGLIVLFLALITLKNRWLIGQIWVLWNTSLYAFGYPQGQNWLRVPRQLGSLLRRSLNAVVVKLDSEYQDS